MTLVRFLRDRSGVAAVEFVMLSPVAFGLLFAIIDAGFLIFTQVGLEHAVESAARCSAINSTVCGTASSIKSYAVTQAYGLAISSGAFSYVQTSCGNVVSASYTYTYFSSSFLTASIPLTAQACFPT